MESAKRTTPHVSHLIVLYPAPLSSTYPLSSPVSLVSYSQPRACIASDSPQAASSSRVAHRFKTSAPNAPLMSRPSLCPPCAPPLLPTAQPYQFADLACFQPSVAGDNMHRSSMRTCEREDSKILQATSLSPRPRGSSLPIPLRLRPPCCCTCWFAFLNPFLFSFCPPTVVFVFILDRLLRKHSHGEHAHYDDPNPHACNPFRVIHRAACAG
jgi:hypothetical protein